ncbi:hypothetical protein EVAR_32779_1 [Eumeta japonica]|uniref:Uncharacterized protein n=1 Tax=Eumeta variegata TaxID=151549 RepID=A0A4C1WEA5_EUMVA|nr:hypothetical protein EVAR_32779_1 [Eumeta japonica]
MRGQDLGRSSRGGYGSVYKAQVALLQKKCEMYGHTPTYAMYTFHMCRPSYATVAADYRLGENAPSPVVVGLEHSSTESEVLRKASSRSLLRLGVTYEKGVTLGNVTMSHRTRERPAECLASLSHSTMIGLPRAQH